MVHKNMMMNSLRVALVTLLALGASIVPIRTAPAMAQTVRISIVFAVDGSGSISGADFQIEKDGIAALLQDRSRIPIDGSVSVGVVQWSDTTRTEVAATVLATTSDLDTVVSAVRSMVQLQGGTGSGDGILAASSLLTGDTGASQTICLTTDGTLNAGSPLASAVTTAQANGVDSLSVTALQDPGQGFTRPIAEAEYGPHVYGGGQVTFSRTAAEFTSSLVSTCLPADLRLRAVEVNQGVQDWNNSVGLVADRPALVRVFAETIDGTDKRVPLRLRGFDAAGAEYPDSPLTPLDPGGTVQVDGDATDERQDASSSMNFWLPLPWRTGQLTLEVDSTGNSLACVAPLTDCRVEVNFASRQDFNIEVVGLGTTQSNTAPAPGVLQEQGRRVNASLPFVATNTTFQNESLLGFAPVTIADWGRVDAHMLQLRSQDTCTANCPDYYVGVLDGMPTPDATGRLLFGKANNIPGVVAAWWTESGDPAGHNVGGHELGHALGLSHTYNTAANGCGKPAGATILPDTVQWNGKTYVALGPIGDPQTEIWGVNIWNEKNTAAHQTNSFIMSPHRTAELMSYCRDMPQGRWPGKASWEQLIPTPAGAADLNYGSFADSVNVIGVVVDGTIKLSPISASAVVPVADPSTNDYNIAVTYGDGTTFVTEVEGIPVVIDVDGPEPLEEVETFIAPAPAGDITSVVVTSADGETAEAIGSASGPVLTLVSPPASSVLDAPTEFVVDVTDPDSSELAISTAYSADGTRWESVAAGLAPGDPILVNPLRLSPSASGLLRITASDGVNVTTLDVPIVMAPVAPVVAIDNVDEQAITVSGAQTLVLTGSGASAEPFTLEWRSSIDGVIGSGEELSIRADQLAEGDHTISLTATTGSGLSTSDTVQVVVRRQASAVVPTITSLIPTIAGTEVSLDVVFSDDDAQDEHTVIVRWGDGEESVEELPTGDRTVQTSHDYAAAGQFEIQACVDDGQSEACATIEVELEDGPGGRDPELLLSSDRSGRVNGVNVSDEDIFSYSPVNRSIELIFDGSDLGLRLLDLAAFEQLSDNTILMSFDRRFFDQELGWIEPNDIVRFVPSSLGQDTDGVFELVVDGSDIGLERRAESIRGIAVTPTGELVISVASRALADELDAFGQDLLVLTAPVFGGDTSGKLEVLLDGDKAGLNTTFERINAVSFDPSNDQIALSTLGTYFVDGVRGAGNDVLGCTNEDGATPISCSFSNLLLLDTNWRIDGIDLGMSPELLE